MSSRGGSPSYHAVKRCADIAAAAGALMLAAPLMGATALAVRLSLGSPVLFRQERVTQDGRTFGLRKFRTMLPPDPARGLVSDADRMTRLGGWLRATSLDELPNLWSILRGDMSFIGPRPLTPDYLPLFTPHQARRHSVRAGLTGLAQVSGRNALPWDDRLDLDVEYAAGLSPLLDLRILLRTAGTVLSRSGVTDGGGVSSASFGGTLRSALLTHTPLGAHEDGGAQAWEVRTKGGRPLGTSRLRIHAGACAVIAFEPHASHAEPDGPDAAHPHVDARLHEEALRVLLSRARGEDADLALVFVHEGLPLPAHLRAAGFRPALADQDGQPLPPGLAPPDGQTPYALPLWPEEPEPVTPSPRPEPSQSRSRCTSPGPRHRRRSRGWPGRGRRPAAAA